jgi:hypothetical protein
MIGIERLGNRTLMPMPKRFNLPTARLPWAVLLLLSVLFSAGCGGSARVYPPSLMVHPATIYIADYGRHSTLLLPVSSHRLVEYEWGDWKWLAYNQRDLYSIPGAMLWSSCSAFARRFVDPQTASVESIKTALFEEPRVISLQVDAPAAEMLRHELDDRFLRDANAVIYNRTDSCCMARDPVQYSIFYNCNHLTAAWLRELGCRVEGNTTQSKFEVVKTP